MTKIEVLALGGLDEKNKNLYILEIDSKIFIIEAGMYEPLKDDFGIQYVIPKLDYLRENIDKVRAIFISTGNKQNIGCLHQIMREFPKLKIYGSDVTIKEIELTFQESKNWSLNVLNPNVETTVSDIKVKTISLAASCPGTFGYSFITPDGNIVYMTDYIFDVISEFQDDADKLKEFYNLSNDKNLLFLSDSLNASIDTSISPKYKIRKYIEQPFHDFERRVVATFYEDEINNIVEFLQLAKESKRVTYFLEEKIFQLMKFLMDKKYIEQFNIKMFTNNEESKSGTVIVTGTRTDLYVRLQNIVIAEEGLIISKDDMIFLASPPQPGNEHIYAEIANDLSRIEPTIVEIPAKEKYSIHPSQFDLKNFLLLMKPKYFMPIKGYYKELLKSKQLALKLGYEEENIIMAENGEVFLFEKGQSKGMVRRIKEIGASNIQLATDLDIELDVIKDRELLAADGLVTIGLLINKATKAVQSNIDIQMRGVIFVKGQEELLAEVTHKVKETIEASKKEWQANAVISKINKELTKLFRASIKKTPYILIQLKEI